MGVGGTGRVGLEGVLDVEKLASVASSSASSSGSGGSGGLPGLLLEASSSSCSSSSTSPTSSSGIRSCLSGLPARPESASCGVRTTVAPEPRCPLRVSLSSELVPKGSEMRTGFEGVYDVVLDELEDRPSQFIGDVREGLCPLGAILIEDTGTNRSSGVAGDLRDLEDFGERIARGRVVVVVVVDIVRALTRRQFMTVASRS